MINYKRNEKSPGLFKKKTVWRASTPHQFFGLAACADEESLVESQSRVDCIRIHL